MQEHARVPCPAQSSRAHRRRTDGRAPGGEAATSRSGEAARGQQAYVSRYETGERMLAVDEFVAVAQAIGVDPVALLAQVLDEGNNEPG